MAPINETAHRGEFLLSEANGTRSREVVVLSSGTPILTPGEVVARITATGEYTVYDNAASDGTEVAAGILYDNADASTADVEVVIIARDAEVRLSSLSFQADQDAGEQAAALVDLAALGVIAR